MDSSPPEFMDTYYMYNSLNLLHTENVQYNVLLERTRLSHSRSVLKVIRAISDTFSNLFFSFSRYEEFLHDFLNRLKYIVVILTILFIGLGSSMVSKVSEYTVCVCFVGNNKYERCKYVKY